LYLSDEVTAQLTWDGQKLDERLRDISNIIMARKDKDDINLWKWLKKVLTTYGVDGMSSDDSVYDDHTMKKSYKTRSVPWRRNIDKELEILDAMTVRVAPRSRAGRAKADRVRMPFHDRPPTTRTAQKRLPEVYYKEDYLRELNELELRALEIDESEQTNIWHDLVLQD
jgi:hypothetical protein